MSSSRLFDLSVALNVPLSYFFDEMVPDMQEPAPIPVREAKDPLGKSREQAPIGQGETLDLVRAYYQISDSQMRRCVFELTKAIAKTGPRSYSVAVSHISSGQSQT